MSLDKSIKYNKSLFIFRRDLRLEDNIGLINSLKKSDVVIPIFIFTKEQLVDNEFKSNNSVQFMMESLDDLNESLLKKGSRLFYFFGEPNKIIDKIIKNENVDSVFVNRDYTPYSKERDNLILNTCNKHNINFESFEDILLHPVGSIKTGQGNIYTKFTPYYNNAIKIKVNEVNKNNFKNYYPKKNKIIGEFKGNKNKFYTYNKNIAVNGGRILALKILSNIQNYKNYNNERNLLSINTTRLSAYIKFGCISIREVYYKMKEKLGIKNDLIKQLIWREFYYNLAEFFPHTLSSNIKERNFNQKYNKVPWITYDKASISQIKMWEAWCSGKTGFPIVDACMNELNTTGFMHNRGRLIVSSFLVKNMFWSPHEGEKYFSQHLVDVDRAVNSSGAGNWGWVAGNGVDVQPYFRVFSPILQSKNYDKDCKYIKKWIPELENVPNVHIHEWYIHYKNYPNINYPKPILDYSKTAKKTIEKYKKALF